MIKALVALFSNEIQQSELVAGDHIYSYRKTLGYLYAHHGIYVGGNRVIHFMGDPGLIVAVSGGESALSPLCADCGFHGKLMGVVDSCVACFLKGGVLRRFRYGVSVAERILALRTGCCSTSPSYPAPLVISRAHLFLRHHSFLRPYHLFHNNCLHFALFCKIGPSSHPSSPFHRLLRLLASSASCFLLVNYYDDYHYHPDHNRSATTDLDLLLHDLCTAIPDHLPSYSCLYYSGIAKQLHYSNVSSDLPQLYPEEEKHLIADMPLPSDTTFSALVSNFLFQSPHLHQS